MKEEIETIRNYSEALKLKVVSEIESGVQSVSEAGRRYSIPGTTISVWLKKYGTIQRRRQVVEVTMKDQSDKIKELQAALAEAHLKARIYEKALELASVEHGFEVKKNFSTGQLEFAKKPGKQLLRKDAKR
jgi:transposase